MVSFATFLKENFNAKDIPLYPFLGNRFNVIFLNGAGIYELFSKLMSFFNLIDKENKLLTAVYYELNVLQYKIGSSALGLIHKLVTGPLWQKLEGEKSVLDMSGHYQSMLVLLQKWASDCTLFVKGEDHFFQNWCIKIINLICLYSLMKKLIRALFSALSRSLSVLLFPSRC